MGNQVIVPLCGVDESMVGFSLNGWEIKKLLPKNEAHTISNDFTDAELFVNIQSWLEMEGPVYSIPFTNDRQNPYYLIFVKETDEPSDFLPIIDVFSVFKKSSFGCWHSIVLKGGAFLPVGAYSSHMTGLLQTRPLLCLSFEEREQISCLFQKRIEEQFPHEVISMLLFFYEACRSDNLYLSFIMRVVILEMMIDGNAELTFRLKRSMAVLLGRDKSESEMIAKNISKIYSARSKFLHNGDANGITDDMTDLAYEYSRRVIANLMCIPAKLETIRTTLEQAGYGDNPYNITM